MLQRVFKGSFLASLFALALAIFISVSLLSVYHVLILVSFVALVVWRRHLDLKQMPASAWALFVFIFAQVLSGMINFQTLQKPSHALGVIKYPLIGMLVIPIIQAIKWDDNELKVARRAFNLFLMSIVVAFVYGVVKVYLNYDLKTGIYGVQYEPRLGGFTDIMRYGYGSGIVLLILVALSLNFKKEILKKIVSKGILITAILFCFSGLYLSYTRGALLGFLVGLPVIVFFYHRVAGKIIGILAGGVIVAMVIGALVGGFSESRFFLSASNVSNTIRITQYQSAWYAFLERPFFGYGPQQLKYHVKDLKDRYNLGHKEYVGEHAHNVFLEYMANLGLLGVASFCLWLILWSREILRSSLFAKQLFLPVVLFIVIAGQVEMVMMAQTMALIYFLYSLSCHSVFKRSQ